MGFNNNLSVTNSHQLFVAVLLLFLELEMHLADDFVNFIAEEEYAFLECQLFWQPNIA